MNKKLKRRVRELWLMRANLAEAKAQDIEDTKRWYGAEHNDMENHLRGMADAMRQCARELDEPPLAQLDDLHL